MIEKIEKDIEAVKDIITSKEIYRFSFKLSELPEHNDFSLDIVKHARFEELFSVLNSKTTYCLYWFECADEKNAKTLIERLNNKRTDLIRETRNVPPPNSNTDSNFIYVGVRQGGVRKKGSFSNISSRIVQHLGYYKVGSTGALHLFQWANDFEMEINRRN